MIEHPRIEVRVTPTASIGFVAVRLWDRVNGAVVSRGVTVPRCVMVSGGGTVSRGVGV